EVIREAAADGGARDAGGARQVAEGDASLAEGRGRVVAVGAVDHAIAQGETGHVRAADGEVLEVVELHPAQRYVARAVEIDADPSRRSVGPADVTNRAAAAGVRAVAPHR